MSTPTAPQLPIPTTVTTAPRPNRQHTTATNTWDPASELTQTVLSAGITESRTWDQAGRLAPIVATHGATTIDSLAYTYDPAGNPTAIATQTHTDTYTYDTRNRLIGLCNEAIVRPTPSVTPTTRSGISHPRGAPVVLRPTLSTPLTNSPESRPGRRQLPMHLTSTAARPPAGRRPISGTSPANSPRRPSLAPPPSTPTTAMGTDSPPQPGPN